VIELDWDHSERSGSGEDTACFELMGLISERVAAARKDGAFPVILSGSCFASVGIVSGLAEPAPGVVWFDAHSDFNTPDTTIEGYLDGMGMSILTGGSWHAMAAAIPGFRPVPETAAMLVGARDFDPLEKKHLDASAVGLVPPERLEDSESLHEAIGALDPEPSGFYLHVDLDVLDSEEAPVNVYSAPNGLSGDQLESLVTGVLERHPVQAMSLTAYDPDRDPDGKVPPIAMRLIQAVGRGA
jgi:arginase